jgi:hypothetical protein
MGIECLEAIPDEAYAKELFEFSLKLQNRP